MKLSHHKTLGLAFAIVLSLAAAAQAATVSYNQAYSFPLSPGNTVVNLPQWDPALFPGQTLVSVELTLDATIQADVTAENDSAISGNMGVNLVGFANGTAPSGISTTVLANQVAGPFAVSATDGNPGSGPDFINFGTVSDTDTDSDLIVALLGPYIGNATFATNVSGNGGFSVSGVTDSTLQVSNFGAAGEVTVTYTFVPEPSSVVMAVLGAAGLGLVARRRRRS